jgi:hypothetical protein
LILNAAIGKNPQQKLADFLYIYDMKKKGISNSKIIYSIEAYYSSKLGINELKSISENTMKKYGEIAKDYIDNARYKELITGKTSSNN